MAQCTAKAKSTGERCRRDALTGVNVCQVHGGPGALKTRGANNRHFKDGRHSKYFRPELAQRYHDALNDPNLLEQRNELAVLDTMLSQAIERMESDAGYSLTLWRQLEADVQGMEKAIKLEDYPTLIALHVEMRDRVAKGLQQAETRTEIRSLIQDRKKVVDSEIKREATLQTMMTSEQAMMLFSAIIAEIQREVTDDATRDRLMTRLHALAGPVTP